MKRTVSLLLAIIIALSLVGCQKSAPKSTPGKKTIEEFLSYITAGEYSSAYGLLCRSCRNDTDAQKSNAVTEEEFINKYTAIFDALEITSVLYGDIDAKGGEILCTAHFTGTYYSEYIGDVTERFSVVALLEGGEWKIEWSPALIFPEMEWGDTVRIARLSAQRGEILAKGKVLAKTAGAISVFASPSKITNMPLFIEQTSVLLDMSATDIQKKLDKAYDDVAVLKQYYKSKFSETLKAQLLQVESIGIDDGNYYKVREYPYGESLAHLVGYVGAIPAESEEKLQEELDRLNEGRTERDGLYTSDSRVGRLGLEAQYETELRGKDGQLVYICTKEGTNRRTILRMEPQHGKDIELTIDMDLQQRVGEVMDLALFGDTTAGAVVVMNPLTGMVQAMYSWPSYDINLFTQGISSADYSALLNDPAKPLINRVTQGLYPPGSTMKAFTAACVLDNEILDETYAFDERKIKDDYWTPEDYGPWIWTKIKRTHTNYPISGPLNMRKALIHSDNIYFANCSLLTGWELFEKYMSNIGFTEVIPFDIAVAKPQLINKDTEPDYKIIADSGYGQGEILVTPLQLAAMFSAFANNGNVPTPYVVDGLYEEKGITYKCVQPHPSLVWKTGVMSQEAIDTVVPFLNDVTDPKINGTGRLLRPQGCKVAAKTGTAEIGNDKSREIAWFVGFRTGVAAEDARLVLVMLEVPADKKFANLKFDVARPLLSLTN